MKTHVLHQQPWTNIWKPKRFTNNFQLSYGQTHVSHKNANTNICRKVFNQEYTRNLCKSICFTKHCQTVCEHINVSSRTITHIWKLQMFTDNLEEACQNLSVSPKHKMSFENTWCSRRTSLFHVRHKWFTTNLQSTFGNIGLSLELLATPVETKSAEKIRRAFRYRVRQDTMPKGTAWSYACSITYLQQKGWSLLGSHYRLFVRGPYTCSFFLRRHRRSRAPYANLVSIQICIYI